MGDNNRGSYSGLVKPVPTITYGEASKINDAYKKLVQQGFKGTYADFRSGFSNKVDDILSGNFKFNTPLSRTQSEILAAGGYQLYLKQKRQEALEQFNRQKAEVLAYNNNPQEYIKTHSGLGVEEVLAPSIELARLAYNNTMKYLNNLNPNGSVRTSRNTVVNGRTRTSRNTTVSRNTVNKNTDVNNNFNVKAFQNWVLLRNKFWKSRDYNNNVYSLGKFGVDGIMGKYTRNAYNALKNEYNRYLKSGMKNYSNFYNKYIYKDPTDLLERINDEIEIMNANALVDDILDTTVPKVEFNPVEPYTHDEYVNNKLNIMRQYKTDPTPQENNHNVLESDIIGLKNTTLFKFGGMIPKYLYGTSEHGIEYGPITSAYLGNYSPGSRRTGKTEKPKFTYFSHSINPKYIIRTLNGFTPVLNPLGPKGKYINFPFYSQYDENGLEYKLNKDGRYVIVNPNLTDFLKAYAAQNVSKKELKSNNQDKSQPNEEAKKNASPSSTTGGRAVTPVQPASTQEPTYQEGMTYIYKNGKFELVPSTEVAKPIETVKPESETTKPEEQKQVTYSDILLQNTDTIKNRISNSGWRGAFKDTLNRALMTPDYYNNGEGTQVFDFELPDGTIINYDYLSGNGMLNRHGLLKAGAMRKLAKNFKQQGRNIALLRYVGVGLNPIQADSSTQPVNPVQIDNSVLLLGPDKINPGIDFVNNLNSSNLTSNTSPRLEGSEDLPEWMKS